MLSAAMAQSRKRGFFATQWLGFKVSAAVTAAVDGSSKVDYDYLEKNREDAIAELLKWLTHPPAPETHRAGALRVPREMKATEADQAARAIVGDRTLGSQYRA